MIPLISAIHIGVSPSKLEFNGSSGDKICKRILINTNYYGNLIGNMKFGKNIFVNNELVNYNIPPEKIGLLVYYPKEVILENNLKEIEVCISGKTGKYKGILIYQTDDLYAGIGVWIFVNIKKSISEKIKPIIYFTPTIFLTLLLLLIIEKNKRG